MAHTMKIIETGEIIKRNYEMQMQVQDKMHNTWLLAETKTTFAELVQVFGEPCIYGSGDGKVDVEWIFETPLGIVTCYNYKSSTHHENETNWHFGGRNELAADFVINVLNRKLGK